MFRMCVLFVVLKTPAVDGQKHRKKLQGFFLHTKCEISEILNSCYEN